MNRTNKKFLRCATLALVVALAYGAHFARAASITTPVNLPNGSFSSVLSGTGTATLTGASGTYKQHIGDVFGNHVYTTLGVSATNQTVGLTMPNVNIANSVASGSANITYDNIAPGTPQNLNSLFADFNGAGGSNQNYNYTISVGAINVTVSSLFTVPLLLTVNGVITNATFMSTGGSAATPYLIPGNLDLMLQGTVTGMIDLPSPIPDLNLGTIFTLASTTISVPTSLPGNMLLTDLSGGLGPYPANMGVDLSATVPFPVIAPVMLPFSLNQSFTLSGHNSGFTQLTINPGSQINANMTLGNPSYDLYGTVPLALIPEPSSFALGMLGLVSLAGFLLRRKRES